MARPRTRQILTFVALMLSLLCSRGYGAEYYTWVDDQGNMHMADSFGKVPERYRDQIERKRFSNEKRDAQTTTGSPDRPQVRGPVQEEGTAPAGKQAKRHEIKYTAREGTAKRVIVQARINGKVTAPIAIDTGAPTSIISASLAEELGLFDNDEGKLFVAAGGIGGTAPAIRTILDRIEVGEARSEFLPTTIVEKLSPAFEGLLGLDFVSNYLVTIDSVRHVVIFEELPVNPEHIAGHDKDWWTALFEEFGSYQASWKEYGEKLQRRIDASLRSTNNEDIDRKALVDRQRREADKLYDKLNSYASRHSVPVHWRK